MSTQAEMKDRWEKTKAELLKEIEEIDQATPWSNVEPQWWLQMMRVQRALLQDESV